MLRAHKGGEAVLGVCRADGAGVGCVLAQPRGGHAHVDWQLFRLGGQFHAPGNSSAWSARNQPFDSLNLPLSGNRPEIGETCLPGTSSQSTSKRPRPKCSRRICRSCSMDLSSCNLFSTPRSTARCCICRDKNETTSSSVPLPCQILVQSIHVHVPRDPTHRSYRLCRSGSTPPEQPPWQKGTPLPSRRSPSDDTHTTATRARTSAAAQTCS